MWLQQKKIKPNLLNRKKEVKPQTEAYIVKKDAVKDIDGNSVKYADATTKIILGDILLAVNGVPVESYDDLRNELDNYQIDDEVTLIVLRDEDHVKVKVLLEEVE